MTNPIINHQGQYLEPPELFSYMYNIYGDKVMVTQKIQKEFLSFMCCDYFVNEEAAHAARIRKELVCSMKLLTHKEIQTSGVERCYAKMSQAYVRTEGEADIYLPVWFSSKEVADYMSDWPSPEAQAAFLYVWSPEYE